MCVTDCSLDHYLHHLSHARTELGFMICEITEGVRCCISPSNPKPQNCHNIYTKTEIFLRHLTLRTSNITHIYYVICNSHIRTRWQKLHYDARRYNRRNFQTLLMKLWRSVFQQPSNRSSVVVVFSVTVSLVLLPAGWLHIVALCSSW